MSYTTEGFGSAWRVRRAPLTDRQRILAALGADPERFARSSWLSKALQDMEDRDPVDALNDAEALLAACQARRDRIMRRAKP